jgi:hypothetical protein
LFGCAGTADRLAGGGRDRSLEATGSAEAVGAAVIVVVVVVDVPGEPTLAGDAIFSGQVTGCGEVAALEDGGETTAEIGSTDRGLFPLFDDNLKGGVGGGILDFFVAGSTRAICSTCPRDLIGDDEEEDVWDSRTAGRPASSDLPSLFGIVTAILLTTGGRVLLAGLLDGRAREPNFGVCMRLGECEEAEVGVEPRLKLPGDPENRVEGVLLQPAGLGGGSGVVSFGSSWRAL